MTRGMMSSGQARSIEPPSSWYTVKVMPMLRMATSAAFCRVASSCGPERREKFDQRAGGGPRRTAGPDQLIEARRRRILFPGNPHAICRGPV